MLFPSCIAGFTTLIRLPVGNSRAQALAISEDFYGNFSLEVSSFLRSWPNVASWPPIPTTIGPKECRIWRNICLFAAGVFSVSTVTTSGCNNSRELSQTFLRRVPMSLPILIEFALKLNAVIMNARFKCRCHACTCEKKSSKKMGSTFILWSLVENGIVGVAGLGGGDNISCFADLLSTLVFSGCSVVLIGGNTESVVTLDFGSIFYVRRS